MMIRVNNSPPLPPWSILEHDNVDAMLSEKSSQITFETPPPDVVQEISAYFETALQQNQQDKVPQVYHSMANETTEPESDSGDDLFITQIPVPEAVRSVKRCHSRLRTGKWKERRKKIRRKYPLPLLGDYNDKSLSRRERTRRGIKLTCQRNAGLVSFAVGGFFKCVKALRELNERSCTRASSLPSVYMDDRKTLSPLSEEDERSADEGIKVVERNLFATSSKAKCPQTWCTPLSPKKRDYINVRQVKKTRSKTTNSVRQVSSQRKPQTTPERSRPVLPRACVLTGERMYPELESASDRDSSHRGAVNRGTRDEHVTSDPDIMNRTETPETEISFTMKKKCSAQENRENLSHQKQREEGTEVRDASTCMTIENTQVKEERPGQSEDNGTEPSAPQTSDEIELNEEESRKDTLSHDDTVPGQEEVSVGSSQHRDNISQTDGSHLKEKRKRDKSKTPGWSGESGAEPSAPQSSDDSLGGEKKTNKDSLTRDDEMELLRHSVVVGLSQHDDSLSQGDKSQVKVKKKKRKQDKSLGDIIMTEGELVECVGQVGECNNNKISAEHSATQPDGNLDELGMENVSVFPVSCKSPDVNNGNKKRKKKRKRVGEDDEDVERSCDVVAEPPNDDIDIERKKKRKKEKYVSTMEEKEMSSNVIEEPPLALTGMLCSGNTKISQRTSESTVGKNGEQSVKDYVHQFEDVMEPRKKQKKKKRRLLSDDTTVRQEENHNITLSHNAKALTENTVVSDKKKKKKRENSSGFGVAGQDEGTDISNAPEDTEINPKALTSTCSPGQGAGLLTKKKKRKKTTDTSACDVSRDAASQSDDSVSVRKKEKKGAGSFPVGDDTVERQPKTHQETSPPSPPLVVFDRSRQKSKKGAGVSACDFETETAEHVNPEVPVVGSGDAVREKKRKKKKKTTSTSEDSVVKDHEDCEKPNDDATEAERCSETVYTGVKRKKHKTTERELETPVIEGRVVDTEHSQAVETLVLKKRKKKHAGPSSDVQEGSISDQMLNKTLLKTVSDTDMAAKAKHASKSSEASANPESPSMKKKKKKNADQVLPEQNVVSESVEIETPTKKKKKKKDKGRNEDTETGQTETMVEVMSGDVCSSGHIEKKKRKGLYNQKQDFLTTDYCDPLT
ncbi:uncharacterized protein ACJ7VT_007544 isoform 2-T2 [Polymixia lowei]